MKYDTINEAVEAWVGEMNFFPTGMLEELAVNNPFREVTEGDEQDEAYFPSWGTMFQFSDSADDYWLEELDGIKILSECGFRVFYSERWGYFFGLDGGGYNFYEAHWIPLYKARGLKWHKEVA